MIYCQFASKLIKTTNKISPRFYLALVLLIVNLHICFYLHFLLLILKIIPTLTYSKTKEKSMKPTLNNLLTIKEGNFVLDLSKTNYGYNVVILESEEVVYKEHFTDLEIATSTAKATLKSLVKAARHHLVTASFYEENSLFTNKQIIEKDKEKLQCF